MKPGDVYNICPCEATRMEGVSCFCLNCEGEKRFVVNDEGLLVRDPPLKRWDISINEDRTIITVKPSDE